MVEETIDLNELKHHNYVLLPNLDVDLQRMRDELIEVRDGLDAEHERVGEELGLDITKKLHLENHQVYRYSLRITKAVRLIPTCTVIHSLIRRRKRARCATKGLYRPGHPEIRLNLHD